MDNDDLNFIDANISTIVDLLEAKGISWGEYQEDLPYTGFEGYAWVNPVTGANDYVRKHNPAVIYNSNAGNADRLSVIKNLTLFYEDLENETLPQWMVSNFGNIFPPFISIFRVVGYECLGSTKPRTHDPCLGTHSSTLQANADSQTSS